MRNLTVLMIVFFISSCSINRNSGELMSAYNNKKYIDIDSKKVPDELKKYLADLVFIPAGSFEYGDLSLTGGVEVKQTKTVSLDPFYISASEVSNAQYREFCMEKGKEYLPDTTVWRGALGFNEALVELYFRHPNYDNYPVVGVSLSQAEAYCDWLNEKINDIMKKYPDLREKLLIGKFRIPQSHEWEYAAYGGNYSNCYPFGNDLIYADKKQNLHYFENFGSIKNEYKISIIGMPEHKYKFTSPVKSFIPNAYGIYDMGGNVSEWTSSGYPDHGYTYDLNPNTDPQTTESVYIRGGSWKDDPFFMMIPVKRHVLKEKTSDAVGFRVMMNYVFDLSDKEENYRY